MGRRITREEWLERAVSALRPLFKRAGAPIPTKVRVACGFPSRNARASSRQTIGECHDSDAGGVPQVFISPAVAEPVQVAAILVHELIHAAIGCEHGHGPVFRKLALKLGLEGKMTATVAGADFAADLKLLTGKLGKYPHAALNPGGGRKRPGSRLLKASCPGCGYTVRVTRKWLDDVGAPLCPDPACDARGMEEA